MDTTATRTNTPAHGSRTPAGLIGLWKLDPSRTFLNYGSYGGALLPVLQAQSAIRERMERDPVRFFKVDLEHLLDDVREHLGAFLNCRPCDLALVPNATIGLATVIASVDLRPGDEILVTDHEYQSILNELERVCQRTGAVVVKAAVPFPSAGADEIFGHVMARVTPRTKIALLAHITSATSLIFPITRLVRELQGRGIDVCVDGAHAPGQIPVDVGTLGAAYYVGSGHKWISAPKGTAFIHTRADRQPSLRSLYLSSRVNKIRPERSVYLRDFDYHGTADYSAILSIPQALGSMSTLHDAGWTGLMRHNHELAMRGREIVCRALGVPTPSPEAVIGTMATVPLPEPSPEFAARPTLYDDPLQDALLERHGVIVPIWRWGNDNQRVVRLSAQVFNSTADYEKLAAALVDELAREHHYRISA